MSAEGSIIRLKHRVHPPAKRKRLELSKVCRKVSTQTVTLARGDSKLEKGRREEAPASCTEKETTWNSPHTWRKTVWQAETPPGPFE